MSLEEDPDPTPVKAGRREWLGLAVLALPTILIGLDVTVLHLAAPILSTDLAPSSSQLLWIIDVYGFVVAGLLVTMGTVGDRIGRRRLLMIGAAGFALRLDPGRLRDQCRAADRRPGAARAGGRHADAVDAVADQQHVPRPGSGVGDRDLDDELHDRRDGRSADRRRSARSLLVGFGVPDRCTAADGPAGDGRSLLPEFRNPGKGRIDLASVAFSTGSIIAVVYGIKELAKDGFHLSSSGDRGRCVRWMCLRAAAAGSRGAADRSAAVPPVRVQCVARGADVRAVRARGDAVPDGAVFPAGAGDVAARGRPVDAADDGHRHHRHSRRSPVVRHCGPVRR